MISYACMHVTNVVTAPGDLRGQEHSRFFLKDLIPNEITKISSQVNKVDKS